MRTSKIQRLEILKILLKSGICKGILQYFQQNLPKGFARRSGKTTLSGNEDGLRGLYIRVWPPGLGSLARIRALTRSIWVGSAAEVRHWPGPSNPRAGYVGAKWRTPSRPSLAAAAAAAAAALGEDWSAP